MATTITLDFISVSREPRLKLAYFTLDIFYQSLPGNDTIAIDNLELLV